MSKNLRCLVLFVALATLSVVAWAEELSFTCATDKPAIGYQSGEKMVFSIQLLADGNPVAGRKLAWSRRGDDQKTDKGTAVSSATAPLVVETSLNQSGFVNVEVWVLDDKGKRVKQMVKGKEQEVAGSFGAGVEPEKLVGVPEPADFDAFWARQKAKLKEVPVKATLTRATSPSAEFEVYDVKVDCPGGKPVSGYLAMPIGAAPKSLAAQVGFMGYGFKGAPPDCRPGMITLNINAHGMENGREAAYYQELQAGPLKGYAFDKTQNEDPEKAYFNGMMLRVMRALEYVKTRPEWNGKELVASGGSQGGLQALTAAGLDPDVTRCFAAKPWCCDLGGVTLGRVRGWRPDWTAALGYYDAINHAKRIHCPTTIITGLGDYTCPASGNSVLYNNLAGAKSIEYIQGATHMFDPPKAQRFKLASK